MNSLIVAISERTVATGVLAFDKVTEDYPLAIAIQDFMPVALTLFGGLQLASWVGRARPEWKRPAAIGTVMLVLGGAAKATWKVIASISQDNVRPLSSVLFFLLSAGFLLLAWQMLRTQHLDRGASAPRERESPFRIPAIIAAIGWLAALIASAATGWSRAYVVPVLALSSLASLAVVWSGVRAALRRQLPLVAAAFVFNYVGVLVLTRLSRLPDQSVSLQWFEQGINTAATAAFAFAGWSLNKSAAPGAVTPQRS
jgi:hypothetical protein